MKGIEMINASAGSGKTYSLTQKVSEKLNAGLMPEALMATTFTNKAAAELRERIRLQLLKDNKHEEAQRIYDGFVGTVNSICARLLTEYALDAGLSPALDVMPEEDSTRLFQISISAVINEHAAAIEPAAKRLGRDGGGSGFQQRPDWRDDVRRIVDLARSNNLDDAALKACGESSWLSLQTLFGEVSKLDIDAQLSRAIDAAITELESIDLPKQTTKGSLESLKRFQRGKKRGWAIPWVDWVRLSKLKTNKDGEGMLDDVNRLAADLLKHPGFHADVEQVISGIFACAAGALDAYDSFKQKQGLMDFVDQEAKVLDLARHNEAFKASISGRLQQLMVDEFQDTSPIQLALFLELHELAGQSIWVGDPKQAIYGFRGTDPQLMDEVTKRISATETLSHSWRSKSELVEFCNHVFSKVFHEMGEDKVKLNIPEARKKLAVGGWLESWNLKVTNNDKESSAIAKGVKDLLARQPDLKAGDVAILCRKNDTCEAIAGNLESLGIRASAAQGLLLQARECQLAMAALRCLQDGCDSVALAEIVHLSPLHSAHENWLASLMQEPKDTMAGWKNDPLIEGLLEARKGLKHLTPLEALETAIDKVGLGQTIKAWGKVQRRMGNLDAMRGACVAYIDQCRARRSSATVAGFIAYIEEMGLPQAQGVGEDTVQVLTYHRAKGLEWPVVIMASLDAASRSSAFGVHVVPAKTFDPADPLANRSIRYWPWPFGAQKGMPGLDEKLEEREEDLMARRQAKRESNRLMYVGMTRARDGMVFAMRKHVTKTSTSIKAGWMDELTGKDKNKLLEWPLEEGLQEIAIADQKASITVRELREADEESASPFSSESDFSFQATATGKVTVYPPARISPSSAQWGEEQLAGVTVEQKARLGDRLAIRGNPEMDDFGNAMHGFLGADNPDNETGIRIAMAEGLLGRWGVENSMAPVDMFEASDRLYRFIKEKYPEAKVLREWPITLRNEQNQLMHGWIDLLLELPDGYVIIDHKSYPGTDAAEHAKQYAPQLAVYKQAVEKAMGKPVLEQLIHMQVIGKVFQLQTNAISGDISKIIR